MAGIFERFHHDGLRAIFIAFLAIACFLDGTTAVQAQESSRSTGEVKADIKKLTKQAGKDRKASRYQQAAAASAQVLPLIGLTQGKESREYGWALILHSIDLMRGGRYREAEPIARQALRLLDSILGGRSALTLTAHNNLASNLFGQGRHKEAEPVYRKVLKLRRAELGPKHRQTLASISNLALNLLMQGRHSEAEKLNRRAFALRSEVLGSEHFETITSLNNLAGNLKALDRLDEAEALFRQALALNIKVLGKKHPNTLAGLDNLGSVLKSLGRIKEAEKLHRRAYAASIEILGERHPSTLISMSLLASNLDRQRRHAESEALKRRAAKYMTETLGASHPDTITAIGNLGFTLEKRGKYAEAEKLHRRTIPLRIGTQGKYHPDTLKAQGSLAVNLLAQSDRAKLAIVPVRAAVEGWQARLDMLGNDAGSEAQYLRDSKGKRNYFTLLADAGWVAANANPEQQSDLRDEAYLALQNAMIGTASRAVAQAAVRRAAEGKTQGLGELVRNRQSLAERWKIIDRRLIKQLVSDRRHGKKSRNALHQEKDELASKMAAIDDRFRSDFPQYFSMIRPKSLDIAKTQVLLGPDEAFLMVVPTGRGTHVIAVSQQDALWVRSHASRKTINAMVKRLLWDVGASVNVSNEQSAKWGDEGEGAYPYDRTTAHNLYQQIVAPAGDVLRGKRHVYISTKGALSSLPFGILVTEKPQGMDGDPAALRATKWFADAHALISIPSIQSLQFLRQFGREDERRSDDQISFMGFGDPLLEGVSELRGGGRGRTRGGTAISVFKGGSSGSTAGMANIDELKKLARLPGTAIELEQMRKALNAPASSVLTATQASETHVRNMDLSSAAILAFATHGLLAGEISGASEPGLVFTPPAIATEEDDGFLSASEVAALRLNADWVILSACNTASGDGSSGAPGLSGLARSFFYAGAKNLLASHWPVRDEVAARLTVRTIEIARDNPDLSRAQAFQKAMREIREDPSADSASDTWAHPNAWAPFTLIGDGA